MFLLVSLAFGIADCSGMISVINNQGRLPLSVVEGKEEQTVSKSAGNVAAY